jgi:hypothetical protein
MALINYSVHLDLSSTVAGAKDLADVDFAGSSSGPTLNGVRKIRLAPAEANVAVDLGHGVAAARLLAIQAPGKGVDAKLNGTGNTPLPVVALPGATLGHLLMSTDAVTSLYLTNKDADNAVEVIVAIAGANA